MKIKVAKLIAKLLEGNGITQCFSVTGGGAMHLNDGIGHAPGIRTLYMHHEQACAIAAEDLRERYPERKIYTVDTLAASGGQGLLVLLAGRKRKAGASIEEVRDFAEQTKLHVGHWFTVDDLVYLKRGGRVSSAAAVVGTMLNIKPVLHVDNEGHLIPMEKVRGRKAAIQALFRHMQETALPDQETVLINHADCLPEAQALAERIREEFHPKEVLIADLGPIIGAHTGPGLVTLFFLAEHR